MNVWALRSFEVVVTFAGAWLVPWLVMRALVPTLESAAGGVDNYRGRRVVLGLGLVWVAWAAGILLVRAVLGAAALVWFAQARLELAAGMLVYAVPLELVLGTALVGMADDVFGSGADKGYRGHLSALKRGRLSTGSFKLLAIGLLAAGSAAATLGGGLIGESVAYRLATWALGTLAMALTANLVNLCDLRPGRALKAYGLLAMVGVGAWLAPDPSWMRAIVALVVMLGPIATVWRFDLGERAMLGDAGANAAGALAGWLIFWTLRESPWMLAAYVVIVLVLNLASERVSFSRVIESNSLLSWLDGLGRLPGHGPEVEVAEKSSREVEAAEK